MLERGPQSRLAHAACTQTGGRWQTHSCSCTASICSCKPEGGPLQVWAPQAHEGGPLHRHRDHAGLCVQEGGPAQWCGDCPTSSRIPCHPHLQPEGGGIGWGSHSCRLPHCPSCPSCMREGGGHREGGASQSPRRVSQCCWDHVWPSCEEGPPSHMGAMPLPLDPAWPPLMCRLHVQEGEGVLFL